MWLRLAIFAERVLQVPLLGAIMVVGADSDFQRQTYGYQQDVGDIVVQVKYLPEHRNQ